MPSACFSVLVSFSPVYMRQLCDTHYKQLPGSCLTILVHIFSAVVFMAQNYGVCSAFCVSWRHALKNIWKLPMNSHSDILYGLSGKCPIEVELKHRTLSFAC